MRIRRWEQSKAAEGSEQEGGDGDEEDQIRSSPTPQQKQGTLTGTYSMGNDSYASDSFSRETSNSNFRTS